MSLKYELQENIITSTTEKFNSWQTPKSVDNNNNTTRTQSPATVLQNSSDDSASLPRNKQLVTTMSIPISTRGHAGVFKITFRNTYLSNASSASFISNSPSADYGNVYLDFTTKMGHKLLPGDESDDSVDSSVSSDSSIDPSLTRGNNSNYSLSGLNNHLYWNCRSPTYLDIETIIQYCDSTHRLHRKNGLISLTQYFLDGKSLTPENLYSVLVSFYKIFRDPHMSVYLLFLNTVTELILVHANDLHDWLLILLTRLFNKLGTEQTKLVQHKIWKTLQFVHEYFPIDLQLKNVLRILGENLLMPCLNTKIAILKFLTNLITISGKITEFPTDINGQTVEKILMMIMRFSNDQKNLQLRDQARLCLRALLNSNSLQIIRILTNVPMDYYLTETTMPSNNDPFSSWPRCTCLDDSQSLGRLSPDACCNQQTNRKLCNNDVKATQSSMPAAKSEQNNTTPVVMALNYTFNVIGELILEDGERESDVIKLACAINANTPGEQVQSILTRFSACIENGNGDLPNKHFRAIMKMLLSLTDSDSTDIVVAALYVLSKIVRCKKMKTNWIHFIEVILLKIIHCYVKGKETLREIDKILPHIAPSLPLNVAINIVNPMIATGVYPLNLCAVKMLNELVSCHGSEMTEAQLDSVFPNLARLIDDVEPTVRKASVFCMVRLYVKMGEDKMKPKLSMLNQSKVRLLNVFIDKHSRSIMYSTISDS